MDNRLMTLAGLSPLKQENDIPEYINTPLTADMQAKFDKMYRQQDDHTLGLNTLPYSKCISPTTP